MFGSEQKTKFGIHWSSEGEKPASTPVTNVVFHDPHVCEEIKMFTNASSALHFLNRSCELIKEHLHPVHTNVLKKKKDFVVFIYRHCQLGYIYACCIQEQGENRPSVFIREKM